MITIDIDAKYNIRPVRFYGDISSTLISMANPKSGAVKTDWIVKVYMLFGAIIDRAVELLKEVK